MKKSVRRNLAILLLAFVVIPLGTLGCSPDFESMVMDFLEAWAAEHDVDPSTAGGAANLARRVASGSTGDEEADAAIGYDTIIRNVNEVEERGEQAEDGSRPADTTEKGEGVPQPSETTVSENPAGHVEEFLTDEVSGEAGGAATGTAVPGITWDEMVNELSDGVKSPSNVNANSVEDVFDKVREMIYEENPETGRFDRTRTSGHDIVDIQLSNGESMEVGIMVTPEGRILYTSNGKDYYPDLETLVDPSLSQQVSSIYSDIKDHAWNTLFEGSSGNPDTDLQNRVAAEVMDDLRKQLAAGEEPKSVADWTEGKLWDDNIKGPLQTGVQQLMWQQAEAVLKERIASGALIPDQGDVDALEFFQEMKFQFDDGKTTTPKAWDEYKSRTGLDLFELSKAGKAAVAGAEFALESIKTMGRGLQDTDFAVRSRAYIAERQANHNPQVIWDRMRMGELPELDIGGAKVASGGVSSMMASSGVAREAQMGVMFTMYEQTYQRYLIAQGMGK